MLYACCVQLEVLKHPKVLKAAGHQVKRQALNSIMQRLVKPE